MSEIDKERKRIYDKDYRRKNRDKILRKAKEYYQKNKNKIKNYRGKVKLEAMQIVSGLNKPKCANCGCGDMRILEINHKNLDSIKIRGSYLYRMIRNKSYLYNDLEITCKVCNMKHYVENRFGLKYRIKLIRK